MERNPKAPKHLKGARKSARNSTKHGLTAVNTIVLDCESEDEFNELLAGFVAMHVPVGAAQQDAVEQMAGALARPPHLNRHDRGHRCGNGPPQARN